MTLKSALGLPAILRGTVYCLEAKSHF